MSDRIESGSNSIWVDSSHTQVMASIVVENMGDAPINYNCLIDDMSSAFNVEFITKVLSGEFGEIQEYVEFIQPIEVLLENQREFARIERTKLFLALDKYDKAVLIGDVLQSVEEKALRNSWRLTWLDLPESYIDVNVSIEELYPTTPEFITYWL